MKYIESLREGERINEIYLCKVKQSALTKAGKPYDTLILQDKAGTLDAKIWEPGSLGIDEFDSLDYIAVMGDITSFQGNLQLNVKRVRKVQEGEYDPKDYLPVSDKDIDQMYEELKGLIASLSLIHICAVFIFVKEGKIMQEKEKGGFSFINEQIKEKPLNKKRLVKKALCTVALAVSFGAVAALVFSLLQPEFSNWFYPEEKPVVTIPQDDVTETEEPSQGDIQAVSYTHLDVYKRQVSK